MIDTKALRQKILDMAIRGELVPQDPNDEPASVLLEKIRTEKQRLIKEGKIKKDNVDSVIFKGDDNRHYEKVGNNAPKCVEDELPFEIPDSWEWVRLGNAFNIVMGQSPDGNSVSKNCNGTEFHQGKICFGKKYLEVSEQKTTMPTKIIKENAVVLCVRAPVGKVNIVERKICIGRGLCAVMPFVSMSIEFIYLLLQTYEEIFNKKATGTTFKAISNDVVFNQIIPLPPLLEQERIAKSVDLLFTQIDTIEQNQAEIENLYDELKKRTLDLAIQGKLVPQDPSDEPASVLLEKIRAEKKAQLGKKYVDSYIYKGDDNRYYEHIDGKNKDVVIEVPFDLPYNWCYARLSTLVNLLTDGTHSTPKYTATGIPFISVKDLSSGKLLFENTKFISLEEHRELSKRCNPRKGDILLTKVGTTGIPVLVDTDKEFSLFVSVALLKFNSDCINSEFFIFLLKSPLVQEQATENTRGVGNKNWVLSDINKTLVVLPPLAEQQRMVDKINKILAKL